MSSRSLIISNDQSTIGIPPLATKPPVFVVIYAKWRGILSSLLLRVLAETWCREQSRPKTRHDNIVAVSVYIVRLFILILPPTAAHNGDKHGVVIARRQEVDEYYWLL